MEVKCSGGGGGSEGEEGYIFRSPLNTNGVNNRKRIKLQGKVSGDCCPVDPALVPRRVRSAMKTRVSQSASPPLSDSKRRQQHACNVTQFLNSSSAERFKQNMLDEVTKAEEEVAETLTSLACLFTASKPVKTTEDGRVLEENSETKAASSASPLEGPKEESTKILVPCNGITPSNPSPRVEDPHERMKADCSTLGQPATASFSQKSGAEANGTSQPDSLRKLSSNVEEPIEGVTPLSDPINLSNLLGASLQYLPGNGMLQQAQLDSLLVQKQEMDLWLLGPTSMELDMRSFKQKLDSVAHEVSQKVPGVQPGLHNRGHEQLTIPSSSKGAVYPNSITVSGRPGNMNGLPAEMLSLTSADKKRPWSKCTTHVNISRLVQSYQKAEKQQQSIPQVNELKAKEGTNHSVPTSVEGGGSRNTVIPPLSSGALIERSMPEARNRLLQNGMVQAQQEATLSGVYAPEKQTSDLLSSSVIGDTKISANGMKSSGQFHIPYPPNQAVMPSAFLQGAYTSQYQEQLAAGTAQQVQLQLPTYITGSQLYGPHTGQAAGGAATKQQQQQQQLMWQAHLAHYSPQVGFPPKWQHNGRQHESSSSPLISQPPSIFPLPSSYNPHNLQQPFILPMPSPSSSLSSRLKQMQQHNGSGLSPQTSSQLHMIYNTSSFR